MLKRTPIKNSQKKIKTSKKRIKTGKKSYEWSKIRKEIFEDLSNAGITACELKYENCTGKMFGSLAHSMKRRYIKTDEEMRQVIFACINCHGVIESLPKEEMYEVVTRIIKARN